MYEITGLLPEDFPDDIEPFYEDPGKVKTDLFSLRSRFPDANFTVLRDGVILHEASLDEDIRSFEIQMMVQEANIVPSGYRRGWGTDRMTSDRAEMVTSAYGDHQILRNR